MRCSIASPPCRARGNPRRHRYWRREGKRGRARRVLLLCAANHACACALESGEGGGGGRAYAYGNDHAEAGVERGWEREKKKKRERERVGGWVGEATRVCKCSLRRSWNNEGEYALHGGMHLCVLSYGRERSLPVRDPRGNHRETQDGRNSCESRYCQTASSHCLSENEKERARAPKEVREREHGKVIGRKQRRNRGQGQRVKRGQSRKHLYRDSPAAASHHPFVQACSHVSALAY